MASKDRKSISVSEVQYERISKIAERMGLSRSELVELTVDRVLKGYQLAPASTPAPAPAPSGDPNLVELEVSEATALAVKAIDATVVHYGADREVLTSAAFEVAIEAAIARFEAAPPGNRSCGICTTMLALNARRLFLADSGYYVWICARCDEQHPRDPDAPRFDGGRGVDVDPVLSLATGGNLAERGRVQVRKGRS